jgi:hypothetical protein
LIERGKYEILWRKTTATTLHKAWWLSVVIRVQTSRPNEHDIRLFCAKDRKDYAHKDLVEYLEEKLDEFEGSIDSLVMYTQIVYDGSCYTASPKLLASMERLGKW